MEDDAGPSVQRFFKNTIKVRLFIILYYTRIEQRIQTLDNKQRFILTLYFARPL